MHPALPDLAARLRAAGAALAAFTCYDPTTARGVVRAAERTATPVVLLVPPKAAARKDGMQLVRALRTVADHAAQPVCVQLDHAGDLDLIAAAAEAGADSVLADGSRLPGGEEANADFVAAARKRLAECRREVAVEAELGRIEGDEDIASVAAQASAGALTDPARVAGFLERSGADLLAVSVGTVHGRHSGTPRLDWDRLRDIRRRTPVPLVLHGASGLPRADLGRAVGEGVGKINVNTELRQTVFDVLAADAQPRRARGLDLDGLLETWAEEVAAAAEKVIRSLAADRCGPPAPTDGPVRQQREGGEGR